MTSRKFFYNFSRRAFTLIELLVVIAIIAILAVVVILTLNPAQLLKQSRDSNRLSDAATIKSAFAIYSEDVGKNFGSSSVVYVSIPDPSATSSAGDQCQGLGLPSASPDTYQCASSSTYRNVNGTGWIPVNLQAASFGSSISSYPVDPLNTTSSGEFYTYETNGTQYETTMALESSKNAITEASDAGQYTDLYEQGTNITLAPVDFYALASPSSPATLRGSSYGTSTGSSVSANWPIGTLSGDLVVFCTSGGYTPSLPSGWTSLYLNTGNTWNLLCGNKILNSSDITTGSLTVSYSGSYDDVLSLYDFVGNTGGVREIEAITAVQLPSFSPGSLTTTNAVINTDIGVYFGSCRSGGGTSATLTVGAGTSTQLQAFSTTNSNARMWYQTMGGGVQTDTLYFVGTCGGEGSFAQVIVKNH